MNEPSLSFTGLPGAGQYFAAQPVGVPTPLCVALAAELAEDFEADGLLAFARRCGMRWAEEVVSTLAPVDNMVDFIAALNAYWATLHWGWIEVEEHREHLLLRHALLPLARVYGKDQIAWCVGFLEGFYEKAFLWAGAEGSVQVRAVPHPDDLPEVQFEVTG